MRPAYGGPGEIPDADEKTLADAFENDIRRMGVVFCCEWFGHDANSEFTLETIRLLRERSSIIAADKQGV